LLHRFCFSLFLLPTPSAGRRKTGKTKAAEQSTAALQTENRPNQETKAAEQSTAARHSKPPYTLAAGISKKVDLLCATVRHRWKLCINSAPFPAL
jgi:hypothetical protein